MKAALLILATCLCALPAARAESAAALAFAARDAKVEGAGSAKFETNPDQQNIGVWDSTNTVIRWTAAAVAKGTYRVRVVLSCAPESAGSDYEVTVGNQRANGVVPATGGWTRYEEADLGPVVLRKAGPVDVALRVTRIQRRFAINVRAVKLVPEQ